MTEATRWRSGVPDGPLSRVGIATMLAVVVVDQISKLIAEARLPFGESIELLPVLTLYRVHNTGIAFSMFSDSGAILIAVMLAISAIVLVVWARTGDGGRLSAVGFALIVGGAAGNLIDRIRLGWVVDFLLLHIGDRTLFVFNLADVALTVGPALILLLYLLPGDPSR